MISRRCAVPLGAVVEVVRAVAVTPLPNVAPIIDGVIDVRGALVPVIDLGQRFGEPTGRCVPTSISFWCAISGGPRVSAWTTPNGWSRPIRPTSGRSASWRAAHAAWCQ